MIKAAMIRFLIVLKSLFQKLVPVSPSLPILPDIGYAHYVCEHSGGSDLRSCPISLDQIDSVIDKVESRIYSSMEREVPSKTVGEYTMEYLKDLDEVAYVRFASVYKQFADIHSFMTELQKLLDEK